MYKKYQFSAVEGTRRTRGEKEKKNITGKTEHLPLLRRPTGGLKNYLIVIDYSPIRAIN